MVINKLINPMLDECLRLGVTEWTATARDALCIVEHRRDLLHKYAFAIPNVEAINKIASYNVPIVEMGAGRGYWAYLLSQVGVDIICYDESPPHERRKNGWVHLSKSDDAANAKIWHPVLEGNPRSLLDHDDRALFLCWPPYNTPMAADCLKSWRGKIVFSIGEESGGCTANDEYFEILASDFKLLDTVKIPQFVSIHDYLDIYERL